MNSLLVKRIKHGPTSACPLLLPCCKLKISKSFSILISFRGNSGFSDEHLYPRLALLQCPSPGIVQQAARLLTNVGLRDSNRIWAQAFLAVHNSLSILLALRLAHPCSRELDSWHLHCRPRVPLTCRGLGAGALQWMRSSWQPLWLSATPPSGFVLGSLATAISSSGLVHELVAG
jgi:hypothetical protein